MNETKNQEDLKIQIGSAKILIEKLQKNNNLIQQLEKKQQNMMQSIERMEAMALASLQDDTLPYNFNRLEIKAQQLKETADTLKLNKIKAIIKQNRDLGKELCKYVTIYELDLDPNHALEDFHIYGCMETGDMFSNKTIIPEVYKKIPYQEWEELYKNYKETKILPKTVSNEITGKEKIAVFVPQQKKPTLK
ncbi:MAG: hypothetical protein PHN72_04600 [Bacilli bacterium]|nr:hypothetical protein [Bacilli bacterium]